MHVVVLQVISRTTSQQRIQHQRQEPKKRGGQVNSSKCDILQKWSLSISNNNDFPEVLHNVTRSAFLAWNRVYIMMFQVMSRMTYPQVNQHRREEPKKRGGQVNSSKCDILKLSPSQFIIMMFFLRLYIWCEILHNCTKYILWCFRSWAGWCLNWINIENWNPRNGREQVNSQQQCRHIHRIVTF